MAAGNDHNTPMKLGAAVHSTFTAASLGSMYAVVRDWAERIPDAPAILLGDGQAHSYRDLLSRIETIGRQLNDAGFGCGDRIALVHPGGPEMVVAVQGIWSFATVVPMNPAHTVGEFALQFRDMGIKAVLVASGMESPARIAAERLALPLLDYAEDESGPVVRMAGECRPIDVSERSGPASADDIATVIVTSGTTGHSKIVPLRHRHMVQRNIYKVRDLKLSPEDRCLNMLRLYHSGGLNQGLCMSLIGGGSVGVLTDFSVGGFFRALDTLELTCCAAPYAFYHAIHRDLPAYRRNIERAAPRLRFLQSGTGQLNPQVAEELERAFDTPLVVTYGLSESGSITGDGVPPARRKRGSVGTVVHDGVAILDEAGNPADAGVPGEVAARGPTVFDGYENDEAANRSAFVNGWYRTGDLGYFDDDGYLFITGRIKELINRGGQKISPKEIDDALFAHPQVAEAVAFPVAHPTLGEEVAAAVVLEPDGDVSAEALSGFVRERLAGFKAPRRIVFADEIPLGPTGKVQRRSLAAAFGLDGDGSAAGTGNGSAAGAERAASEIEARLAALWADALGLDHVGLDEDFFLLGGDSLQAVELFLRVEKAFGQRLPRSVLFEAGTVSAMARHIAAAVPSSCIVPIQPEGVRSPFFCVHGGTGEVLNFRDLAKHLGPDQPFYAIQASGLDGAMGPSGPLVRVEDIAAHYIGEMKKVQPSGPYYLGGFSYGGRVAFVMARQLRAAGERVDLLALLDPYSRMGRLREPLKPWLGSQWQVMRSLGVPAVPGYLWRRMRRFSARWSERGRLLGLRLALRHYRGREEALPGFLRRPEDVLSLARDSYRPEPYAGSAVLFQAERNIRTPADAHAGWRELVQGGLEVYPLACKHHEIMEEPYVQDLARELTTRLNGNP